MVLVFGFHISRERLLELTQCSVASKRLRFLNNMSYSQRLIFLDLESLDVRPRLREHLLLTYKIVLGMINIDSSKLFTLRRNGRQPTIRGHSF